MTDITLDILRRNLSDASKLKHISSAKGGEWCSPCPVCGGKDRFRCWPNQDGGAMAQQHGVPGTWWCRQCDQGGDVFDLLKFAEGLEFRAACKELRIELAESSRKIRPLRQPKQEQDWVPAEWKIPSEKWRLQATKLANEAHKRLLGYGNALAFLAKRGLPLEAVQRYRLGYIEGEDNTGTCLYRARKAFDLPEKMNRDGTRTRTSLWIPRGFTIPLWHPGWQQPDEVHRVRFRRRKGDLGENDQKYLLLEGSGQAPMVLLPEDVSPALASWVVVEAELDAMAVHFACGGKVGVIAVLTNRGKPDAAAHKWISQAPVILVALDFDPPGKKGERPGYQGWLWWKDTYAAARRWPSSQGKDPGEDFAQGVSLAAWVNAGLPVSLAFATGGDLGVSQAGLPPLGEGESCELVPAAVAPERREPWVMVEERKHWAGALAGTPVSEAQLPSDMPCTPQYLRNYYAGKQIEPELLIICPKTKPAWYWLYYKYCAKCPGHPHCLVNFFTSPQMLAPYELENSHV